MASLESELDTGEETLAEEILNMSTADITARSRLLDNEVRIMRSELGRIQHELQITNSSLAKLGRFRLNWTVQKKMISPQSSLELESRKNDISKTNALLLNQGGLGSEGSSGMSSDPVFRDSNSSKRLGSAESGSSGLSSTPPVFEEANSPVEHLPGCSGCMTKDPGAVAKCFDCSSFLCANCVMAHHFVTRFEGHHIVILGEVANKSKGCDEKEELDVLSKAIFEGKIKAEEISKVRNLEATSYRLSSQYKKAMDEVNETYQFYVAMLQERRVEVIKELEQSFSGKQVALSVYGRKARQTSDKIQQVTDFGERLMKHASASEVLLFKKPIQTRLHQLLAYMPALNVAELPELEFITNFEAIQGSVRNQFGYVKTKQEVGGFRQQPPIGHPATPASSPSEESQMVSSTQSSSLTDGSSSQFQDAQKNIPDAISPIKKMYENPSLIAKADATQGEEIISSLGMSCQLFPPTTHFSSTPMKPASSLLAPLLSSSLHLSSLLKSSNMEDLTCSQYDKWANSSDNLFNWQENLRISYGSKMEDSGGEGLDTGSPVLAKYSVDGQYYRARIQEVVFKEEDRLCGGRKEAPPGLPSSWSLEAFQRTRRLGGELRVQLRRERGSKIIEKQGFFLKQGHNFKVIL